VILILDDDLEFFNYFDSLKTDFQQAEDCPTEVIQRFINRSWRFIEAYRKGLSGKAAAWAVQKQKQHRKVSERAMVEMEN